MESDFEKDIKRFKDRVWKIIPLNVKKVIIPLIVIGGIIFGVMPYFNNSQNNKKKTALDIATFNQSAGITAGNIDNLDIRFPSSTQPQTQNFACRFYVEVLANTKELNRIVEDLNEPNFNMDNYKFIYDDYDRYNPAFDSFGLDVQIKNFYTNLKKVAYGYSYDDLIVTRGQGRNILNELASKFGCQDYFEGSVKTRAISSDTVFTDSFIDPRRAVSGVTVELNNKGNKGE